MMKTSEHKSLVKLASNLPKGDDTRRAILAGLKKISVDSRAALSQMFQGHFAHVKDPLKFLKDLREYLEDTDWSMWGLDIASVEDVKIEKLGIFSKSEPVPGRNWDEPEYDIEIDVVESMKIAVIVTSNFRELPRLLLREFQGQVTNPRGFILATVDMLNNKSSALMLGKLLTSLVQKIIEQGDVMEEFQIDVIDEAKSLDDTWSVEYSLGKCKVLSVSSKVTGTGLIFKVPCIQDLKVESTYTNDEDGYDDDRY